MGLIINQLVKSGKVAAPIVIGRDHVDCGSMAAPSRETKNMIDGSDAVADWPLLNFSLNAVSGASWLVSTKAVEQVSETHYTQGW